MDDTKLREFLTGQLTKVFREGADTAFLSAIAGFKGEKEDGKVQFTVDEVILSLETLRRHISTLPLPKFS